MLVSNWIILCWSIPGENIKVSKYCPNHRKVIKVQTNYRWTLDKVLIFAFMVLKKIIGFYLDLWTLISINSKKLKGFYFYDLLINFCLKCSTSLKYWMPTSFKLQRFVTTTHALYGSLRITYKTWPTWFKSWENN